MTQITNLLHLVPDIEEELRFLPPVTIGRAQIHEKMLRPLCARVSWSKQREFWRRIRQEMGIA